MNAGRWLTASALVLIAVAVLAVRPAATPGPFLRDFEAYWSAGATWNARADPYGRAIWNAERTVPGVNPARDELLPFAGPPPALLVWSALARLPYAVAASVWIVVLALAALALAIVTIRASGSRLSAPTLLAVVASTLAFGPLTSGLALGQIALLAFLAATVAAALTASPTLPAIAIFLALLQPNVALGLVSLFGRARTTLAIALGVVATYGVGAYVAGWGWPTEYVRRTLDHARAERFSAIQLTPAAIAHGAGAAPAATAIVAVLAAVGAFVAAIAIWRRVENPFARFAAFSALTPFAATFFHEHDLIVAYAAAIWCALRARGTARLLALAGTLLVAIDWLGLAQRPSGIAQSALLAAAIACAFIALANERNARATAVTLAPIAALFMFGAWLAAGHPAPVWPDALVSFRAAATASAPSVWHDEQQRSGLFTIDPAWAFLRTLSLAGCALLALAIAANEHVTLSTHGPGATSNE